jgi:hypothetical protein
MDEATAFMDPSTEATLQRDLDRMLTLRGPVTEVRRLVAALDRVAAALDAATACAPSASPDPLPAPPRVTN